MSKSQRLRLSDVRGVSLLLGECRELGADADGWRHLLAGVCRLDGRDRRLIRLLHRDLGPLVGATLAASWEPNLSGLSPRVRQTLDGLSAGESVKGIAARLGIGRRTVEDHVKELHRHCGASGRGELLARASRRRREEPAG